MKKYFLEKLNASDDTFKITDIYLLSGSYVENGEIIISIESSKADIEIEVQESGYLYYNISKGDYINVGDLFYVISKEKLSNLNDIIFPKSQINNEGISISKKAFLLIEKNGISLSEFKKTIIKEADVLDFLKNKNNHVVFNSDLIINNIGKIPLIIIGAGGGAKMCIDLLETSSSYQVVGLLDDNIEVGTKVLNVPVIGNTQCIEQLLKININHFVIAFGVLEKRNIRFELYTNLKKLGCEFPNIIHPKSIVENSVVLGEGNVILAGANVGSCVKLGNLNYINNSALISHDCVLMDNIHIAPGAVLASSIIIESHVLIGMNTTIYYGLKIGESSTILNGLIINNNVDKNIIQKTNN